MSYIAPIPHSVTPKVNMPITIPVVESPTTDLVPADRDGPAAVESGLASRGPATATATTSPNLSAPAPDAATVPSKTLTKSGEDNASAQAKMPLKRKRFRPSQAKSTRCASQHFYYFSTIMFTVLRGVAERKWSLKNHFGTRAECDEHFTNLSDEQLRVCTTTADNNPTNIRTSET